MDASYQKLFAKTSCPSSSDGLYYIHQEQTNLTRRKTMEIIIPNLLPLVLFTLQVVVTTATISIVLPHR
jgi:hypothetical protein